MENKFQGNPVETSAQESMEAVAERFRPTVRIFDELRERGLHPLANHQNAESAELTLNTFISGDVSMIERGDCPNVIFMAPHSGEYAPQNLFKRLTDEGKAGTAIIDAGTFFITQSDKIPHLATKLSRFGAGFDLNRRPPEEAANPNAPGSFIWDRTMTGGAMYKPGEEPTEAERAYLSTFHAKYYKRLEEAVEKLSEQKKEGERVLMLDVHAFVDVRSQNISTSTLLGRYLKPDDLAAVKEANPLFILSDRQGFCCDDDIKAAFGEHLRKNFDALSEEDRALLLAANGSKQIVVSEQWFTAGGYNAEHGNKVRSDKPWINTLQLEINPTIFVDFDPVGGFEHATYNDKKLAVVKQLLEKSVMDLHRTTLSSQPAENKA